MKQYLVEICNNTIKISEGYEDFGKLVDDLTTFQKSKPDSIFLTLKEKSLDEGIIVEAPLKDADYRKTTDYNDLPLSGHYSVYTGKFEQDISAAELHALALVILNKGMDTADFADEFGFSMNKASKLVKAAKTVMSGLDTAREVLRDTEEPDEFQYMDTLIKDVDYSYSYVSNTTSCKLTLHSGYTITKSVLSENNETGKERAHEAATDELLKLVHFFKTQQNHEQEKKS